MSLTSEYYNAKKKRKKEEEDSLTKDTSTGSSLTDEYYAAREKRGDYVYPNDEVSDEDIAPVIRYTPPRVEEEEKWYDNFLQLGDALSDGYQFGDISKTLLGSDADIATNIIAGVVGWGEDVIDAGAALAGTATEAIGWDGATKKLKEFAEKDLYDDKEMAKKIWTSPVANTILGNIVGPQVVNSVRLIYTINDWLNGKDDSSIFGDNADAMMQSAGEIVAKRGLQVAAGGVPIGDIITGVTVYGSQAEQALKEDATFMEASGSGLISAGAEIMFEKLSGGIKIGGTTLDEGLTRLLSKKISDVALRTVVNAGLDVGGEAFEEFATEFVSKLGTKLYKEEDLADILFSEEALQDYIQASFTGGLMGGGFNAGNIVSGVKGGYDYKTGLDESENTVVNEEYKRRVTEEEKDGNKLTIKQKNKLYDAVKNDLEKGYISIDTIEEVLGGDDYKAFKEAVSKEEEVLKELSELYKGDELIQQIESFLKDAESNQLKGKLSESVYGLVRGSRLANSYYERARRGQAFEADLSKYDEKQAAIVQKAIDSGILNNTNRTHEFVDLVAKISADKGVSFDFANNHKLKESGFALNGKTINGLVTEDGVTLNIDSAKSLNTVVGHEITHVLEDTELYEKLQEVVFEYAKGKKAQGKFDSEYQERLYNTRQLYKGVNGYKGVEGFKKIKKEVVADLVGDYLFTDQDFVMSLSTKHRNVFQKIYDEIKYLYNMATAGSKEARELEKVKRAFDKAYKESGKASEGTKYSMSEDGYADTYYSQMAKVVDDVKQEKLGASSVINMLRGKGVKAEEIKWSGLEEWLEGKKSVTKAELQEFIAGNQLSIEEETLDNRAVVEYMDSETGEVYSNIDEVISMAYDRAESWGFDEYDVRSDWNGDKVSFYVYKDGKETVILEADANTEHPAPTRWDKYKIDGGDNYREIVFKMPNSDYGNLAMSTHWEQTGVLAHARIQDIETRDGKKMLFVEEIQSDWHNAGQKGGYRAKGERTTAEITRESDNAYGQFYETVERMLQDRGYEAHPVMLANLFYGDEAAYNFISDPEMKLSESELDYIKSEVEKETNRRNELQKAPPAGTAPDAPFRNNYHEYVLKRLIREAAEKGYDSIGWTPADIQADRWSDEYAEGYRIEYDQDIPSFLKKYGKKWGATVGTAKTTEGYDVWSMDITPAMKQSVLYEGQPKFSLSDSDGKKLTKEQSEYFKDSKMRDDNGNLMVMYHGSQNAGFHIFDPSHSDDGISLFFVDRNEVATSYSGTSETYEAQSIHTAEDMNKFIESIGAEGYEVVEKDGKFTLLYEGDRVADSNTAKGIYDEFCWYEGVGNGDANYKVYLNLTKPLLVDAKNSEWSDIPIPKEALKGINESWDNPDPYGYIHTATTRQLAEYAKANGYDGVIIKNVHDNGGYSNGSEGASTVAIAFSSEQVKSVANEKPTGDPDIRFSLSRNAELMQNAEDVNNKNLGIDLTTAKQQRQEIYDYMMKNADRLKLPEDIEGNTAIKNSSYDITEENTTVCIRSMAADALCDAVAEELGRPLTVQDTLRISQDLMNYTDEPECVYCYVATDRKAYREFLGSYYKQMQSAIEDIRSGKNPDEVYKTFLDGRKDTKNMQARFAMWEKLASGGKMISAKDLASEKMMQNAMKDPELAAQVKDARAYAQSASWAKKRMGYQSYDGHILDWSERRINDLNKHYGLRFYSFSDFSPAFVLENMQQMTDASVRGLKGLAYTKVLDFAEIFAPTGANINISVFGYDQNGTVAQDGMMGADWKGAQDLRSRYENVGVTFVATNDTQIEWALDQEWIDVVIPYHLVRTGQAVAKHFGYTNYTGESADTKGANWQKGDKKTIYPAEHNNDKQTYLNALAEANLEPRFARWVNHPNYMKLVNETRRSAKDTPPMKAEFNVEAAKASLDRMAKRGGYFVPIGGDYANMQEIAGEIANDIRGGTSYSLSPEGETPNNRGWNIRGEDVALAPTQENIAPVEDTAAEVAPEVDNAIAPTVDGEQITPEGFAPVPEEQINAMQSESLASLTDADAPPEVEAPIYEESTATKSDDPFTERDYKGVGNRKVKAYMSENPEVRPYFQQAAQAMLGDLQNSTKGERFYNDEVYSESGGESGWGGTKRHTTDDIAYLLDKGYSYAEIEKGLNAIIQDHGAENIAVAKRIEFALNDRLRNGYTDIYGEQIPPNEEYLTLFSKKQAAESIYNEAPLPSDADAPVQETAENIAPVVEQYEAIKPQKEPAPVAEPRMKRADNPNKAPAGMEERSWVETSTGSESVDNMVTPDDIPDDVRYYQVKSNKKTLAAANARLEKDGYAKSREYFEGRMSERKLTVEDIALGERLIQEAAKAGDAKAVRDLIIDVSIIGTELGQRVQALSLIRRLTPEGQLKALQRTIDRGKAKGDKAFDGVEVTEDMTKRILDTIKEDGTFDQAELNGAVEDVKQQIANQMSTGVMDYINAWRYLSMLGNPKTHIRNFVSNVAMMGTREVKNAVARTIEDIAPIKSKTKTWHKSTDAVKDFAKQTTKDMDASIKGDTKYSEEGSIKAKRQIFKTKVGNALANANNFALEWEDAIFSKTVFKQTLQEYLTANGIKTEADIKNNPELVEKAKDYALEEARRATFRQDSWVANKIAEIEKKNPALGVAVGSVIPFKKTPINVAKTGLAYSPLGFARNIYDAVQVKKGNMDASEAIDHLAQTLTGTSLTVIGFALASMGVINGAGEDDKEGKYDYQLGKQSYSFNLFGNSYSLSWLSPVAMPLFVGANAYETLVEQKEWDANVVVDTLAQTLDPLSEMSFLSSLDDVLSSYDSGVEKIWGAGESMVQNYVTQFVPTLSSQIAATFDDTKRSTKASRDSGFKFGEETVKKVMYKIPGLRNTLEPTTDIWGNEAKQTENFFLRGFESFFSPANKREGISTEIDEEIKDLYRQTGKSEVIPSIPYDYINYDGEKYNMSAQEHTAYKQTYGQTAYDLLEQLFDTNTYKSASSEERADMVRRVYDYARDNAKKEYFDGIDVDYTNATKNNVEYYKENSIVGAIKADLPVDEYEFSTEYPDKYKFFKNNGISYETYKNADEDGKRAYSWAYENPGKYTVSKAISDDFLTYYQYKSEISEIAANNDSSAGIRDKDLIVEYINNMDLDYGQKIILFRSMYDSKEDRNNYNYDIVEYLNSRDDISYDEVVTILKELGFTVDSKGNVYWD